MSTLTKEWLQRTIAELEVERDSVPGAVNEDAAMALAAMKLARASLEAEPIGAFHIAEQQVGGTTDYMKDGEWPIDDGVIEVYAAPPAPFVPDGWVMVPVEPTEHMIVQGFESEPDESFSDPDAWEAYDAMSGCQQAAHRAKLCWTAMIAAAPKPRPYTSSEE